MNDEQDAARPLAGGFDARLGQTNVENRARPLAHDAAQRIVETCIRDVLGEERLPAYAPDMSLRDMGFGSLELMALSRRLANAFNVDLDATFLFRYSRPASIAAYFRQSPAPSLAARPSERRSAALEPIAIIGMACRFPGGANSPAAYWTLLRDGVDAISEVPASRFDIGSYLDGRSGERGTIASRFGGFLDDVDKFDAAFFRISPREAAFMDPQQRLLLEVAWEAFEDAGLSPMGLAGSSTGVFTGIFSHDYEILQIRAQDPRDIGGYYGTGNSASVASGRIAYYFDLRGPALSLNTACSSALAAVHLACASLRAGECALALATGVNLILAPELSLSFSHAGMLSPDGRCKTFALGADGYVRSEGCGAVVLKPLSRAILDGDHVLAVIRGSAVTQDGASNGLTAPSAPAQAAAIKGALAVAGLAAEDVGYVEAHGTGTSLGDAVEMQALASVFAGRGRDNPLILGAAKTNIGHTEAAAGMAGLIKLVLALRHEEIPPHLHCAAPDPALGLEAIPAIVPSGTLPWRREDAGSVGRIGGVSSFGFSGTNAHVVVGEAPVVERPRPSWETDRGTYVVAVSGRNDAALRSLAGRYASYLESEEPVDLGDFCHTANVGRSHFERRAAIVGESRAALIAGLRAVSSGPEALGGESGAEPRIGFLFTGQGSQWAGMGRDLYEREPVFRAAVERCVGAVAREVGADLLAVMWGDRAGLDRTEWTQPALFALEWGLAELWRSWGIAPVGVLGHSVGEYVAASVAGVMSVEDGMRLVTARGRLMAELCAPGSMVAVRGDEALIVALAQERGVSIAALNGPGRVVLSGAGAAIAAVAAELAAQGCETTALAVSHGFHSAMMEPMLADYGAAVGRVALHPPHLALISNVSGAVAGPDIAEADYWVNHVRATVRFGSGLRALRGLGIDALVELGPSPVLSGLGREILGGEVDCIASLRRGRPGVRLMLEGLGALYRRGARVDWAGLDRPFTRRKLHLPTYPFQRRRFWIDDAVSQPPRPALRHNPTAGHPLLGSRVPTPLRETLFAAEINALSPSWLADHRVHGRVVVPAAAYLDMALAAGAAMAKGEGRSVAAVAIQQALVLSDDKPQSLQCIVARGEDGTDEFRIYSRRFDSDADEPGWSLHVLGRLLATRGDDAATSIDLTALTAELTTTLAAAAFYDGMARRGIDYGANFRAIVDLRRGVGAALARLRLPAEQPVGDYQLHPILLDAAFQTAMAALPPALAEATLLPVGVRRLALLRPPSSELWAHARLLATGTSRDDAVFDIDLIDDTGAMVALIEGLALRRAPRESITGVAVWADWLYREEWRISPLPAREASLAVLPAPATIAASVSAERDVATLDADDLGALTASFDRLGAAYTMTALRDLGWTPIVGAYVTGDGLVERLGIIDRHRRIVGRLLATLAEDGVLRAEDGGWTVIAAPSPLACDALMAAAKARFPAAASELALLERCGGNLAGVLTGACEPLSLIYPDGELDETIRLYRDSVTFGEVNRLLRDVVLAAASALPPERTLRILEIGAGTGGTTAHLLPHLPARQTEYVFTDVTSLFTRRAKEQFGDFPFVDYRVLDIERDPDAQGYRGRKFNLVIAANVLHATADLEHTIAHARRLLAPEGLLILLEGTRPARWIDLIFGLTEGWWRFADTVLRPSHPLLDETAWCSLLDRSGFSGSKAVVAQLRGQDGPFRQAVIIAQASSSGAMPGAGPAAHWLILADASGVGRALAAVLAAEGAAATIVEPGRGFMARADGSFVVPPSDPAAFRQLIAALRTDRGPLVGVIDLWPLDQSADMALSTGALGEATERGVGAALHLLQAVVGAGLPEPPALFFVARGTVACTGGVSPSGLAHAALGGLVKTIALEHPELKGRLIDLDPAAPAPTAGAEILHAELSAPSVEVQIAYRAGWRHVARISHARDPERAPLRLTITERGALDRLSLEPMKRCEPGPGEIEIRVRAAGLNFLDLLDSLGVLYARSTGLGAECVGDVTALGPDVTSFGLGDRVMAVAAGGFADFVTVPAALAALCPRWLDDAAAATLPVAYLTAWYALHHVAQIKPGDRVLIHAATGGTGMAALHVARAAGAKIFATASPGKWDVLRRLGVERPMNSRTLDFAAEVMEATGDGVDIVLNSLAGDFIGKSLAVLAPGGRFLEIGKTGVLSRAEAAQRRPDVAYHLVDLLELCRSGPATVEAVFAALIAAIEDGRLAPLPHIVFPVRDAVFAFRYMQQARHVGKIVLAFPPEPARTATHLRLRDDGSYLVTGGFGGLGLKLAGWLVERGARHIALLGRHEPGPEAAAAIAALREAGVAIRVIIADIADEPRLAGALDALREAMPPLRGVFHAAGTLDDGVLTGQSLAKFQRVMAPKVAGAWALHRLTAKDPLELFVLFSSVASLLGSAGQANHSAANAFLDAVAHHRRALGLPGLSINWGGWAEIGAAASASTTDWLGSKGVSRMTPSEGLAAFEAILGGAAAQIGVLVMDWAKFIGRSSAPPFLAEVASAVAAEPSQDLSERLRQVPVAERRAVLIRHLRGLVARVLSMEGEEAVPTRRGFFDLGLDSLTSVELRNLLRKSLGCALPATVALDYPTVEALADHVLDTMFPVIVVAPVTQSRPAEIAVAYEALSDREAEALLLERLEKLRY